MQKQYSTPLITWFEVSQAVVDDTVCHLKYSRGLVEKQLRGEFFLHDDGHWYRIDPPARVVVPVTHFRPVVASALND
mgnify:CR=1 FL=1